MAEQQKAAARAHAPHMTTAMMKGEKIPVYLKSMPAYQIEGFDTQAPNKQLSIEMLRDDVGQTPERGTIITIGNRDYRVTHTIRDDEWDEWIEVGVKCHGS